MKDKTHYKLVSLDPGWASDQIGLRKSKFKSPPGHGNLKGLGGSGKTALEIAPIPWKPY